MITALKSFKGRVLEGGYLSGFGIGGSPGKSTAELVAEIHDSFYTEVERIIADAGILPPISDEQQSKIARGNELARMGFSQCQNVKEGGAAAESRARINKRKKEAEGLKRAVEYFRFKYPMYKFITEEGVKRVCAKYGLVYGDVNRYKGKIPLKNLNEMKAFKIAQTDKCYGIYDNDYRPESFVKYDNGEEGQWTFYPRRDDTASYEVRAVRGVYQLKLECQWEIAAPVADFDTSGMEVRGHMLVDVPDPVVLQPVYFEGMKHYLIVTAWGDEASDEEVVNERKN